MSDYILPPNPKIQLDKNFATNVNPLGPPGWLLDYLSSHADEVTYYPELWHGTCDKLIEDIFQIKEGSHLLIPGTSLLLFLLPFIFGHNVDSKKWASCSPTFWEYPLTAKLNNITFANFPLPKEEGKNFYKDFVSFIDFEMPDALFICTPNNPTGHHFSVEFIKEIAVKFPKTKIILDLTYAFFQESFDAYMGLLSFSNIIVILSYSKFFCIPGLRVGSVFFSDPHFLIRAREIMGPLRVNTFTEKLLPLLIQDHDYINKTRGFFKKEWRFFNTELAKKIGDWLIPSTHDGCYKLFFLNPNLIETNIDGDVIAKKLLSDYGIRVCSGSTYGIKNAIRIRIGRRGANIELINSIKNMKEELLKI